MVNRFERFPFQAAFLAICCERERERCIKIIEANGGRRELITEETLRKASGKEAVEITKLSWLTKKDVEESQSSRGRRGFWHQRQITSLRPRRGDIVTFRNKRAGRYDRVWEAVEEIP